MLYYKGLNDLILKKIILTNFGKFENYILDLDSGLNIVYGKNEAGKSTIQAFIHGMFYGFIKPNVKKTIYLDELKKYEPFDRQDYRGSIVFEYEKTIYRIERIFKRNYEDLKIYNEVTGEDITRNFANLGNNRIIQPGFYFFDMDYRTFKNTICIGQNEIVVDKKISEDLRERLSNSYQTNSENISINNALKILEEKRKEIGSTKAKNSDYARIIDKLEKNEQRLNEIKVKEQEYDEYRDQRLNVLKEISRLNTYIEELNQRLNVLNLYERYEKYLKARSLIKNIELAKAKLESSNNCIDVSDEDINSIKNINEVLEDYKNEIKILERQKSQTLSEIEGIEYDENRYAELIAKRDKLNNLLEIEPKKEHFNQAYDIKNPNQLKIKVITILIILLSIIDISISFYAYNNRDIRLLISVQVIWFVVLFLFKDEKKLKEKMNILKQYENEREEYFIVLKKEGFDSIKDLTEEIQRVNSAIDALELDRKDINRMEMRIKDLEEKMASIQKSFSYHRQQLDEIFSKYGTNDFLEIYNSHEKQKENKVLKNEIQLNETLLKTLLKSESFEELENEFADEKVVNKPSEYENKINLEIEIRNKEKERTELEKKLSNLEGILKSTYNLFEEEMFLNEENQVLKDKLEKYDFEIKAIDIAESTINRISEDIHLNFAPEFNRKIGEKINMITGGKYSTIKMDKEMSISVLDPKANKLIGLDKLSYGTVDQINFALRLALSEELGAGKLPIILDEPFAHFDDERLLNTLEILNKITEERQVILFTCHKTEQTLLNKMKYNANFLQISN